MSDYLKAKVLCTCDNVISILDNVNYDTVITLHCPIHDNYTKTVKQILYKNKNCPICTKIIKNKKLSEIGKTKVGSKNNFYGHKHTEATLNKLRKPLSQERRNKISKSIKSIECQNKIKSTSLKKYNTTNPLKSDVVKNKIKTTMINKYGGFGNSSLIIRDHMQNTCKQKYGVNSVLQVQAIRDKGSSTMLNKYGVDNALKRPKNQLKARLNYSGKITKPERQIIEFIKTFYNKDIKYHTRFLKLELDIFLPDLNLAIEYNSNYWHSYPRKCKNYHIEKSKLCRQFNIRLIHIYEFEDFSIQLELLKSLILGQDLYNKNDFNKNNLINKRVYVVKYNTDKGIVYTAGKLY